MSYLVLETVQLSYGMLVNKDVCAHINLNKAGRWSTRVLYIQLRLYSWPGLQATQVIIYRFCHLHVYSEICLQSYM